MSLPPPPPVSLTPHEVEAAQPAWMEAELHAAASRKWLPLSAISAPLAEDGTARVRDVHQLAEAQAASVAGPGSRVQGPEAQAASVAGATEELLAEATERRADAEARADQAEAMVEVAEETAIREAHIRQVAEETAIREATRAAAAEALAAEAVAQVEQERERLCG